MHLTPIDWMTDDILVLKALWRKTRLTVHFDMYSESCMAVKKAISKSKYNNNIYLKSNIQCT